MRRFDRSAGLGLGLLLALLVGAGGRWGETSGAGGSGTGTPTVVVSTVATTDSTTIGASLITGLGMPVLANHTYLIRCFIFTTTADLNNGGRISFDGPTTGSPSITVWLWSPTASGSFVQDFQSTYGYNTTAGGSIAGVPEAHIHQLVLRNGSTAGTVTPTMTPELNVLMTAETGSFCEQQDLGAW